MLNSNLFKCLCSVGQIAVAAIILGRGPQSSFAFAPSIISRRHHSQQYSPASAPLLPTESTFSTGDNSEALRMSEQNDEPQKSSLPTLLDPGTKGGAVVLSILLFILPIVVYNVVVAAGVDEIDAGRYIGVGFTVLTMLAWGATYIFRVATKDMTYAKQLKDYEDAVIAKRLEELDEDEVQALVEDIEREQF